MDLFLSCIDTSEEKSKMQKTSNRASVFKTQRDWDSSDTYYKPLLHVQDIRLSLHRTKINKLIKFKSSGGVSDRFIAQIHSTIIPAYVQD